MDGRARALGLQTDCQDCQCQQKGVDIIGKIGGPMTPASRIFPSSSVRSIMASPNLIHHVCRGTVLGEPATADKAVGRQLSGAKVGAA